MPTLGFFRPTTVDELRAELRIIAGSLRRHLEWRKQAGIMLLAREGGTEPEESARGGAVAANFLAGVEGSLFSDDAAVFAAQSLQDLKSAIGDCRRCKLWPGRTHLVFGTGNAKAAVMFVGEGPGRDEDLQGEPFVGRAGQLLTDIITKGMNLRREDVYIANVIKCRPPENRNPEPDEIESCEPFLRRQIDLVKPKIIVALGKFAVQTLLQTKVPIMRLRGTWHNYHGIKLMPTLHPAYLLRNPGDKRLVWEDVKKVLKELGLPAA
jgi:uracil-DNA glycosylase